MAVKSYQAQGEGEISLSKGEKIKGDRVGLGGDRVRGSSRTCVLCTLGTLESLGGEGDTVWDKGNRGAEQGMDCHMRE